MGGPYSASASRATASPEKGLTRRRDRLYFKRSTMEPDYPEIPEYLRELAERGELEEIRIDPEGNWLHRGEPFANRRIIEFFNRSVAVTREGGYVLHYADFTYPIVVDDAPVFVTGVRFEGVGESERVRIITSLGNEEDLDIRSLHYRQGRGLYCYVREGTLLAKFRRSPSFQIMERLEESEDTFAVTLCGRRIVLSEKTE